MFKILNGEAINVGKLEEEIQEEQAYLQSDEYKQIQVLELKQKLADTDYIACKIAEGSATAADYADEIAQRQLWRNQINQFESEMINNGL